MKKTIVFAAIAAIAVAVYAASSQTATAPGGTDNIAIGYGAGYGSSGGNRNVICLGTDAGKLTANNTNCIFIGANAGANVTRKSGYIDIGGTLVHSNGVTSIKGVTAQSIGFSPVDWGCLPVTKGDGANSYMYNLRGGYIRFEEMYGFAWVVYDGYSSHTTILDVDQYTGSPYFDRLRYKNTSGNYDYLLTDTNPENLVKIRFENGMLNVYTNDMVKVGTLTFTPLQ